jgi:hypothetical protein
MIGREFLSIGYVFRSALGLLMANQRHKIASEIRIIAIKNGGFSIYTLLHFFDVSGAGVNGAGARSVAEIAAAVVGLLSRML